MRTCLLTLAWLLLGTVPASAATLTASSACERGGCRHTAVLRGAPEERNAVTVTSPAPRVTEIRDAGAPVTLRTSGLCEQVDERSLRCTAPEGEHIEVAIRLGDGDDTATTDNANVAGGPGADRLTGQSGTLSGGPGQDVLTAGPEGDVVSDVEDADGGSGDDVLIGTPADNELEGGRGADRIVGGAGDDTIHTGILGGIDDRERAGPDRVDAGAGRDTVHVTARQSGGSRIDCGAGRDEVVLAKHRDLLRACGDVGPGDTLQHVRLRELLPRPGAVFLTARACDCQEGGYVARARRTVVARGRGRRWAVRLRLNTTGRRLLASRGRLAIAVSFREPFGRGGFRTVLRSRRSDP